MPANIEQGMEVTTTRVLRQLPRNTRIMSDTSSAAMMASDATFWIAARTKTDWSKSRLTSKPSGAAARISGSMARADSTTVRLEASAALRICR